MDNCDLSCINGDLISKAIRMLKPQKKDAIFDSVSDMYREGPQELSHHLTIIIRSMFSHGIVPSFLLLCTLTPIVKDSLGDMTASSNYHAIAGGSLLIKLFDLIVLHLEDNKLKFDDLQMAYQKGSGTTVCTWMATTVINHFNNRGRPVYGASMDMTKAFDMVDWGQMFEVLRKRRIKSVLIRLLLYIYKNQICQVKWGNCNSSKFTVNNGVTQGAVSSAIFFALYIEELITILRRAKLGCEINGLFYGIIIYADDILLLSGSRNGLQSMVDLSFSFAKRRNLTFSIHEDPNKSKTKCIVFQKKKTPDPKKITLNGKALPWVSQLKYLGSILQSENSMALDIAQKRGIFIGAVNSLLQEFYYVNPEIFH